MLTRQGWCGPWIQVAGDRVAKVNACPESCGATLPQGWIRATNAEDYKKAKIMGLSGTYLRPASDVSGSNIWTGIVFLEDFVDFIFLAWLLHTTHQPRLGPHLCGRPFLFCYFEDNCEFLIHSDGYVLLATTPLLLTFFKIVFFKTFFLYFPIQPFQKK